MNIDLNELEALAKTATPGPWRYDNRRKEIWSSDTPIIEAGYYARRNVDYIVAANPTVVLELIAELRKLRAELEYVRELHAEVSAALRNKELDAMLADNELMEFMQKQ